MCACIYVCRSLCELSLLLARDADLALDDLKCPGDLAHSLAAQTWRSPAASFKTLPRAMVSAAEENIRAMYRVRSRVPRATAGTLMPEPHRRFSGLL